MEKTSLVSTEWLASRLGSDDIRVLDGSWHLPGSARNAVAEFAQGHIPGAAFFDIDVIAETMSTLPHMLPRPDVFAAAVQSLGISNRHFVVVYDTLGIYSAPRVWWMFRAMGHDNCAVLDGGLPKWRREGRPVTTTPSPHRSDIFGRDPVPEIVRNYREIQANMASNREQVLDARNPSRFAGAEPEPRPGVRPGHIPGSTNTYYADLINADGTMKSPGELRTFFSSRDIDLGRPIVTSCGSGITAAIVFLAAELAGARELALYDGSWAEWGSKPEAPIETGPG